MIRDCTELLLLLGSLIIGCRPQTPVSTSPLAVPTDPCPTKETYSPGSDTPPELISIGSFDLSPELKREFNGVQVVVSALIDGRGRPVACTVTIVQSADPRLNEPARAAVIGARYRPARLGGVPVPTWLNQPIVVRLNQPMVR